MHKITTKLRLHWVLRTERSHRQSHAGCRKPATRATETSPYWYTLTQGCSIEAQHSQLPVESLYYDVVQAPEAQRFSAELYLLAWQREWWGTYLKHVSVAYPTLGVMWAAALSFGLAVGGWKQITEAVTTMRVLSDDNLILMTDSGTGEKQVIAKHNLSTLSIPQLQALLAMGCNTKGQRLLHDTLRASVIKWNWHRQHMSGIIQAQKCLTWLVYSMHIQCSLLVTRCTVNCTVHLTQVHFQTGPVPHNFSSITLSAAPPSGASCRPVKKCQTSSLLLAFLALAAPPLLLPSLCAAPCAAHP